MVVLDHYRGISLMSIAGKVWAKILNRRLEEYIDPMISKQQFGFRKERGTRNAIFTVRRLVEMARCKEDLNLHLLFIDFKKAYDSIIRENLWLILELYGVPSEFIQKLKDLHEEVKIKVKVHGKIGREFFSFRGLRQGCVLAPLLFNIAIDFVIKKVGYLLPSAGAVIHRRNPGIFGKGSTHRKIIDSENTALYADDMTLLSHKLAEIQQLVDLLITCAQEVGLSISTEKSKLFSIINVEETVTQIKVGTFLLKR